MPNMLRSYLPYLKCAGTYGNLHTMSAKRKRESVIYVEQIQFKEPRGPRAIDAIRGLNKTGLHKTKIWSIADVIKRGPGLHEFHYAYAKAYCHVKLGRMYANGHTHTEDGKIWSPSVQGMYKELRNLLVGHAVIDVDMVNCHPTLLLCLVQSLSVDCPLLKNYITNRASCFRSFFQTAKTDAEAKKTITVVLFGGRGCDLSVHGQAFASEIKGLHLLLKTEFPRIYDVVQAKTNKTGDDLLASFVAILLQTIENQILQRMMYLARKMFGWQMSANIYDGFHVWGTVVTQKQLDELCQQVEDAVPFAPEVLLLDKNKHFQHVHWRVQLMVKPMTEDGLIVEDGPLDLVSFKAPKQFSADLFTLNADSRVKVVRFNKPYLAAEDLQFKDDIDTLIVQSALGTGKSTAMYEGLIRPPPVGLVEGGGYLPDLCGFPTLPRIASISNRVTLYRAQLQKSDDRRLGFYGYQRDRDWTTAPRKLTQLESLHKVRETVSNDPQNHHQHDLVYLDEPESILAQFQSTETHKEHLRENAAVFANMVSMGRKLIATDGLLTNRTLDVVARLRDPARTTLIVNEYQPYDRIAVCVPKMGMFKSALYQSYTAGERVAVVWTTSVEDADKMVKSMPPEMQVGVRMYSAHHHEHDADLGTLNCKHGLTQLLGVYFTRPSLRPDSILIHRSLVFTASSCV